MLRAYFDDSGTHQGSLAAAVAAYVSTEEGWLAFGREWCECLDAYDIGFFHMTDFASRKKQFSDWPVEKCGPRFRKLASIINRHVLYSVGAVVPEHMYDAVASIDRRARPYQVAARECLSRVAQFARGSRIKGRLEFVFESGTKGNGELLDAYNRVSAELRQKHDLGPLTFADKKLCLPLQAADILAFSLFKEIPRHIGSDSRPSRTRELDLLKKPPHAWHFATRVDGSFRAIA